MSSRGPLGARSAMKEAEHLVEKPIGVIGLAFGQGQLDTLRGFSPEKAKPSV